MLGTAGGLYRFREEITDGLLGEESYIFVLHCDVLCQFPLQDILDKHRQHKKLCTLLTKRVRNRELFCFVFFSLFI